MLGYMSAAEQTKGIAIGTINSWWCEFSGACSYPNALRALTRVATANMINNPERKQSTKANKADKQTIALRNCSDPVAHSTR
jgi:hypothetical protein